jgi:CheY-like chemotaxis protein
MKTEFISNVSHELRTPLTSILGFTRIIKKKLEESVFPLIPMEDKKNARNSNQIKDNIDIIVKEGERLTSLINDVLDIAKMEAGKIEWKMSTISMNEIVDRAIASTSSLFNNSSIVMQKEIQSDLPQIIGDRDRLIQVVINLISNAYKFTNHGTVTVRAKFSEREVVVSIVDSGIGISKEDHHKVFEKFKQVGDTLTDKPKGTGLGLPICKQIVEHHNGVLWVESEIGKGSTFSFSIPVTGMVQIKKESLDFYRLPEILSEVFKNLESPGPHKNILIVDDEKNIRDLLKQELEYVGYNTIEAVDGIDAIEKIKKNNIDLIILDVMMPELNGFDVASTLRSDPATISIPIIILTIVEDQKRGLEIGVDDYQHKPIQPALLLPKIEELLKNKVSKKNIMIVHEDQKVSNIIKSIFEKVGHTVYYSKPDEPTLPAKLIENNLDLLIMDSHSASYVKIQELIFKEQALKNLLVYITNSE